FEAWTQPKHLRHWWSPKGFTCPVSKVDLRPGGGYLNCMRSPEGKDYWSRGVYREIVEPERIVGTDSFADENGNPVSPESYGMSPDWPAEALIEVTFADREGKTEVTVRYSPVKPGSERDMCRQGWNECLISWPITWRAGRSCEHQQKAAARGPSRVKGTNCETDTTKNHAGRGDQSLWWSGYTNCADT
ncbi:MAG: SRPBCC domain-containing protein, partial [Sedimentisphaerales bacterium]